MNFESFWDGLSSTKFNHEIQLFSIILSIVVFCLLVFVVGYSMGFKDASGENRIVQEKITKRKNNKFKS